MTNKKTALIVGGASAASLAVGASAGYFFAFKKFQAQVPALIQDEVDKTKKHYSILLMEARAGKPESPADIPISDDEEPELPLEGEDGDDEQEELSPADLLTVQNGKKALVDYAGASSRPSVGDPVVENNIFTAEASNKRPAPPPREPGTGRFLPRNGSTAAVQEEAETRTPGEPYLIGETEFLENDPEHTQESLLYFANDDTVVLVADYNEVIDEGRYGKQHLENFPVPDEAGKRTIYVRHEGLQEDYQIEYTEESLTTAMGLGEDDADLPPEDDNEYAYQG